MGRKKRKVPQINGASSADIAFMLLLFFLLTTSMDTDQGLLRTLPRPPEKNKELEIDIKKRNVLNVRVSSDNRIMCAQEIVTLPELRAKAIEFIDNPFNSEDLPEKELRDIPFFGQVMITFPHLISLQCDRGTNYQTYIDVQNELAAAYNTLRNELSLKQFKIKFSELDEDKKKAVMEYYKQKISEAEPLQHGEKKQTKRR